MKLPSGLAESHSIRYGDSVIRFDLRLQQQRRPGRIAIHIEPDGRVVVDASPDDSNDRIRSAVSKRAPWIERHLMSIRARRSRALPREYVSGEAVHYLGRRYRLKVVVVPGVVPTVRLRGGFLEVMVAARNDVEPAIRAWYRQKARDYFAQRLVAVSSSLRWVRHQPKTRLAFLSKQWGSCSPSGTLTLNALLVQAPRDCVDYVLLHELCHLREHNHSRGFYQLLERHLPNWRSVKSRLDGMADEFLRPNSLKRRDIVEQ